MESLFKGEAVRLALGFCTGILLPRRHPSNVIREKKVGTPDGKSCQIVFQVESYTGKEF